MLQQGDTVICSDNRLATIVDIQDDTCRVRYVGTTVQECYYLCEVKPSCEGTRQLVNFL